MKRRRITKEDLTGCKAHCFRDKELLNATYDDFESVGEVISWSLHKYGVNRVDISNDSTGMYAEYKVTESGNYKRIL